MPVDVLAEVQHAVAMLNQHGPLVTEALRRLDRATTLAWQAVNLVQATNDEWRFVRRRLRVMARFGWDLDLAGVTSAARARSFDLRLGSVGT